MIRTTIAFGTMLFAATAFAQMAPVPAATPSSVVPAFTEVQDNALTVPGLQVTVGTVEDYDLYDSTGRKIGDVEEVLADGTGQIAAFAVEIEDDILGQRNDDDLVIGLGDVRVENNRLVTDLTNDQLIALPTWDD